MTTKNSVFITYQGSSVSKKSIILNISPNMLCEFWDFFFFGSVGNSLILKRKIGTHLSKILFKKVFSGAI